MKFNLPKATSFKNRAKPMAYLYKCKAQLKTRKLNQKTAQAILFNKFPAPKTTHLNLRHINQQLLNLKAKFLEFLK
jgi:hypothetical protein